MKAQKLIWILMPIVIIGVCIACAVAGVGNRQIFDVHQRFDYTILSLPNGKIIEGPVDSWTDFDDGDQIQVTVKGITYLLHSANCVLIDE